MRIGVLENALARSRTRRARLHSRPKSSPGKEARKASQRWLMPVTNTILQGSHLRDIRNPIRGFDLHKPTLDRVTRGHLTSAHLHAAANKDGRCSFAAIFAIMRATTAPWCILDALFLTSAFRLIILFVVPAFVSSLGYEKPRKLGTGNSVESLVTGGKRWRTRI